MFWNFALLHVSNLSIQGSNFPDKLKITRVTTIFKRGNEWDMDHYRPMSFLYRASQKW